MTSTFKTLYILPDCQAKIHAMVDACDTEVNGLAKLEFLDGKPIITDIAVTQQEVTGTTAEHDKDDLLKFFEERSDIGDAHQWRVQWHSHVNMGVFFSGTDTDTIDEIGVGTDWFISIVFNKSRLYKARLDIFQPFRITLDELDMQVIYEVDDYTEWAKAEKQAKVKMRTYTPATSSKSFTPGSQADWNERFRKSQESVDPDDKEAVYHENGDFSVNGKRWRWKNGEYKPLSKKERKRAEREDKEILAQQGMFPKDDDSEDNKDYPSWMGKNISDMTDAEWEEYNDLKDEALGWNNIQKMEE